MTASSASSPSPAKADAAASPANSADGSGAPPLDWNTDFPPPTTDQWRERVERDLKGADFDRRLVWRTYDGIDVQPVYTRADLDGIETLDRAPGDAPFVRGTQPPSGASRTWQIRQDSILASPEDVNAALHEGIGRGQTSIGLRLDNAARHGLDGDAEIARDLSGRGGCTISSINGLRIALADIDLERWPITVRTGTAALSMLAILVALADERGANRRMLTGGVEFDPLRDLADSGTLRAPIDGIYREIVEMVNFCRRECPGMRPIMVNGHAYHNAGASGVQELALTMAAASEYLAALTERGVSANDAALSMAFSLSASTNFFPEIAKLRAARGLWAKIATAYGATDPNALHMFLHVRGSAWTKTLHDPYNNLLRTTVEGMAGALGGCDSMYLQTFDEMIGRPDDVSMRHARNQHLLLQHEAHLCRVDDPAGGSYYVEKMTDETARAAWALFQKIEAAGGLVAALQSGLVQEEVERTAAARRKNVATRRDPIVGVSNYPNPDEKLPLKGHLAREAFLDKRRERLHRLKSLRRNSVVRELLDRIATSMSDGDGSLMDTAVQAAREGATIGEITAALNRGAASMGTAPTIDAITPTRASVPFERLRGRVLWHTAHTGKAPEVLLIPTGPLAMRKARAGFARGFFGAGGFHVVEPDAFEKTGDAVVSILERKPAVAVLCSDDATYPTIAEPIVNGVRGAGSRTLIYVAGYPADDLEALKAAGVDGFVHLKADVIETLTEVMDKLAIS